MDRSVKLATPLDALTEVVPDKVALLPDPSTPMDIVTEAEEVVTTLELASKIVTRMLGALAGVIVFRMYELAGWMVKTSEAGAPGVKVTVAVWVMVMLSVVSVAVKTGAPVTVDFTVNEATPEALVVPETVVMVSVAPRLEAKVTVFPATGLEAASLRVTVMVDVVAPSAVTEVGLATVVD